MSKESPALFAADSRAVTVHWLAAFTAPTNGARESYCPRPIGGEKQEAVD